ncbi:restriction endonuclease [Colwellia sp. BRX10-3]|uniref:restriction endonuclease n=1 Tax=Colwellia sp. BRX10-3 TaxID=2759844 RepID=UPI0015F45CE5|nr:restriction endonuclease [Colwellia sp. BRX10-3]MBA6391482.1 restriction endonuclease [Colwellia sp. BRX10-3]
MPQRTNDFQKLILRIHEILLPNGASLTESKMILDEDSGSVREVDICIETTIINQKLMFMIECRNHSRKQSTEWIEQLITKAKSLKANKVIAISHKGFYKPAIKLANKHGIETLDLVEAQNKDWDRYKIQPGIALISHESYQLHGISIYIADSATPFNQIDNTTPVFYQGKELGSIIEFIEYYFKEHLTPELDDKMGEEFKKLVNNLDDARKLIQIEVTKHLAGLSLHTTKDIVLNISKVQFLIIGTREVTDIQMEHKVFDNQMISFGQHLNSTHEHDVAIIQKPDSENFIGNIKISRK